MAKYRASIVLVPVAVELSAEKAGAAARPDILQRFLLSIAPCCACLAIALASFEYPVFVTDRRLTVSLSYQAVLSGYALMTKLHTVSDSTPQSLGLVGRLDLLRSASSMH